MIGRGRSDGRSCFLRVPFVLRPFLLLPFLVVGRAGAVSGQATEPLPHEAIEQALHGLGHATDDPFDALRRAYHLSVHDRDYLVAAEEELDGLGSARRGFGGSDVAVGGPVRGETEPLVMAYRGALEIVRARHARWPPSRLSHLRAGTSALDRAVAAAPSHVEVRYLRLVSEAHLPWPFRRDAIVTGDRDVIRRALSGGSHGLTPELASLVAGVLDTMPVP